MRVYASVLVEGNVVIGAFKGERYGCGSSSPSMDSDVRMRTISTFQLNLQHKDFSHTPFTSVDYCYSSKCMATYLHTSQVCVSCVHMLIVYDFCKKKIETYLFGPLYNASVYSHIHTVIGGGFRETRSGGE